ncbi:hypothetical protein PM082_024142 [Marasmius tenuissimus]|nr:hypothetical protein PM082_024142 [Marasmius tenuissimus]
MSPALRAVARRTMVATVLTLMVLSVNVLIFFGRNGHEVGFACTTSCAVDVILSAIIFYWVSSGAPSDSIHHFTLPTISAAKNSTCGESSENTVATVV